MAKNKLTVFQTLERALKGNWNSDQGTTHINSYDMSGANSVLYKTTDKEDYEKTKLELQQNRYLKDRWVKANVDLSVSAFSNLSNVKLMYRDADLMDSFPEIGAALDTVSEESCLVSSNSGEIVNVYSKSDRIKAILEDLFVNRLNLQVTAPMIIRQMCKYGNQFMLLDIDNKLGVKDWKQLPVFNVERLENGIQNPYGSNGWSLAVNNGATDDKDLSTKFVWYDENNSQVPFRNWQIAHFRLLTNSMCLPYGCSYLNSARRHWRLLSLMEDMMLIYRLERSIERRVYKIYVGAIDDADVQAYVENIANNFKRTPIIDPMTGQIDLRKNILPVHKDTPIPLLDGRTITIENLAKEYAEGRENYVYSVQDKSLKIVPGKVVWCGKNYTAEKLVKITLDDDSHMILAPEHEIIMRDGSKKRADEVKEGESVMPLYRKNEPLRKEFVSEYEKVYNPNTGKYEFTHRLIAENLSKNGNEKRCVVHHRDFNRMNNSPLNLEWMTWKEHADYHTSLNNDPRILEKRRKSASNMWKDDEKRKSHIRNITICFDDYVWSEIDKHVKIDGLFTQNMVIDYVNNNLIDYLASINKCRKIHHYRKITKPLFKARLLERGFNNIEEYFDFIGINNKELLRNKRSESAKKFNVVKNFGGDWRKNNPNVDAINKKLSESLRRYANSERGMEDAAKRACKFDEHIWDSIRTNILNGKLTLAKDVINFLNTELIDYLCEINPKARVAKNRSLSNRVLLTQVKEKGFKDTNDYITSVKKNHKVKAVEYVVGDDVYCMTVVGLNGEEDRHNFALTTWKSDGSLNESGVFVSNCVDQDLFIPVRDSSAPTPIDTLPAAQNLTAIDDIKYIQNKVLTALRIPKSFLNFEENAGDGKNLALMDIRFTRVINRVQQAFLMELTKVASIHLYLLGFEDDLTNFNLTMNNPSTQAEQLEIDNTQKKITAFRDAVSDPGNGLPAMSYTRAAKEILKWSDKEIKDNLEEIRLEKAISAELEKTVQIIKRTGIFDTVDRMYGEPGAEYQEDMQQGGPDGGMGGGMPGGGGGGGFGGGLDDLGAPGMEDEGDITGEEGAEPTTDMGGDEPDMGAAPEGGTNESRNGKKPLLTEEVLKNELKRSKSHADELFEKYVSRLNIDEERKRKSDVNIVERTKIYDKSLLINEEFNKMIESLNELDNDKEEAVE